MLTGDEKERFEAMIEALKSLSTGEPIFDLDIMGWQVVAASITKARNHPHISPEQLEQLEIVTAELIASVRQWSTDLAGRLEYWADPDA